MELIKQIAEELKELGQEPTHRSTLRIYNLLENNKALFLKEIDADNLRLIMTGFEGLSQRPAMEYKTEDYRRTFARSFETLRFYLNRII